MSDDTKCCFYSDPCLICCIMRPMSSPADLATISMLESTCRILVVGLYRMTADFVEERLNCDSLSRDNSV
jgi:hypothetical protein